MESSDRQESGNMSTFIIGALVGSGIALLFAPQAGVQMRAELEQVLHDELGVVWQGVIRFGRGLIREMIHRAVPAVVETVGGIGRDRKPRR